MIVSLCMLLQAEFLVLLWAIDQIASAIASTSDRCSAGIRQEFADGILDDSRIGLERGIEAFEILKSRCFMLFFLLEDWL
jgi:hypothetical protein